jgi:hypothetical protein
VSEGDLDLEPATLFGELSSKAMKKNGRTPVFVPSDLDLPPADRPGAGKRLESLVHGFFGGDAGGCVAGRVGSGVQVLPLTV